MREIFDFEDVNGSATSIIRTWNEFRSALARKDFNIDEIDLAVQHVFLRVFNDYHNNIRDRLEISLESLSGKTLLRGAVLKSDDCPNYNRFIPNAEYITKDNRFSPPGIEWLYLAIDDNNDNAWNCVKAECRANPGDRLGSCEFKLDENSYDLNVVDLTVADNSSQYDINCVLENAAKKFRRKTINRSLSVGIPVPMTNSDDEKMHKAIETWLFKTYAKLLSDNVFLPLTDSDDKQLMYAPFQCLANYFISKGYAGIIYKSTVFKGGKNIVLFDRNSAYPTGDIKITYIV